MLLNLLFQNANNQFQLGEHSQHRKIKEGKRRGKGSEREEERSREILEGFVGKRAAEGAVRKGDLVGHL